MLGAAASVMLWLGVLDGAVGGGQRIWTAVSWVYPPQADTSYDVTLLNLGMRAASYERTGKRAFQLGAYLYNKNSFTIFYEVVSADYNLGEFQNVSSQNEQKGRVLSKRVEPVDLSPIYMSFPPPGVYKGNAEIVIRYGRNQYRLGNIMRAHARIYYRPAADKNHQLGYVLYPDSTRSIASQM